MSKKHNKHNRPKQLRPQIREIIADLDKKATKKGRGPIKIKGDKAQTKVARGRCIHYTLMTKNGKASPTTEIKQDKDGNRYFYCTRCKASWYPDLPSNDEVKHVVGRMTELTNRYKFLAVNLDIADGTKYASNLGAQLARFFPTAKKINKIVDKDSHKKQVAKGKKRNKGNGGGGYAPSAGAWYTD